MTEAIVDSLYTFSIDNENGNSLINEKEVLPDIRKNGVGQWHVLLENVSYQVVVHKIDREERTVYLKINNKKAKVKLSSKMERLLKALGMESAGVRKVSALKSPMPCLIHSIKTAVGDEVKKGDTLLILEAMKMENIIKSPTDGVISEIHIKANESVEKDALLISFD